MLQVVAKMSLSKQFAEAVCVAKKRKHCQKKQRKRSPKKDDSFYFFQDHQQEEQPPEVITRTVPPPIEPLIAVEDGDSSGSEKPISDSPSSTSMESSTSSNSQKCSRNTKKNVCWVFVNRLDESRCECLLG